MTSEPGRENISEVSRLCRALIARQAQLGGTDPAEDQEIQGFVADISSLPDGRRVLWYMASWIRGLQNRLNRVRRETTGTPPLTFVQIRDALTADGQTGSGLLDDVFAILREVEVPAVHRDQAEIDGAVLRASRQGWPALFTFSYIALRLGRTVVSEDPSVESLERLLSEISLSEEIDLIERGED